MKSATKIVMKALSPGMLAKAIMGFDRLTLWIILLCWSATIGVMMGALYTVNLSVQAKKEAEAALATEPTLPEIRRSGIGGKELQVMLDRLQRRYPEVSVSWSANNNVLTIAGGNGSVYHQWLTAIGQVDTIYPQFHWKIAGMCVGKICDGKNLMAIDLVGETIAVEMPQVNEKK